jgi:hypothetical protein
MIIGSILNTKMPSQLGGPNGLEKGDFTAAFGAIVGAALFNNIQKLKGKILILVDDYFKV